MFVGTTVCVSAWTYVYTGGDCSNDFWNLVAGGLMYGSYLYLFVEFAVKRFLFAPKEKPQKKKTL
jgi:hypothetical protein